MSWRRCGLVVTAFLPSRLKSPCYRFLFGYKIGRGVQIGLSLIDADRCEIGDNSRIGHFNLIAGMKEFCVADDVRIGFLNIIRGGDRVTLRRYAEILRMNEITSLRSRRITTTPDPQFILGASATVTVGHKIDFTDHVSIGRLSILGGRNSSIWTHTRGRTAPVDIGSLTFVGSEIRMSPGSRLPARSIVGIGSVVVGSLTTEETLIAGVPAKVIRKLVDADQPLVDPWEGKEVPSGAEL